MFDPSKNEHGHESFAEVFQDPKHGKSIILRPTSVLEYDRWVKKQRQNKDETDAVRAIKNPAYFIPEIRIVDRHPASFAIIEHAPGERLSMDIFNGLSPEKQDKIIFSVANFLNDINQSKPIETYPPEFENMEEIFDKLGPFISKDDREYLVSARDSLNERGFKIIKVWSHGDLRYGNVFYDAETETVSFIDFGEARYKDIQREVMDNDLLKQMIPADKYEKLVRAYFELPKKQPIELAPEEDRETYDMVGKVYSRAVFTVQDLKELGAGLNEVRPPQDKFSNAAGKVRTKKSPQGINFKIGNAGNENE